MLLSQIIKTDGSLAVVAREGSEAAVVKGAGNRLGDGVDGAVQGSVIATYLHGPCLARNPELADLLLSRVVGALPALELPEVDQLRRERLAAPRRM